MSDPIASAASAASGVEAILESRANGFPIYGETLHQYLMFTQDDYKRANGYSELEISQKRSTLENVMIVDSEAEHRQRFASAGFGTVRPWFRFLARRGRLQRLG